MTHFIRWILLLVALAPLAIGQEHAPELDQARSRWERLSPAERARIAQHFDEFRGLPEAERARMMSHLNRLAQARREIEARIPEELRAKLDKLAPEERRQVLREYVETTMGERAERLREKMTAEELAKLDGATPAEREELLHARREELLDRAPRALAFLGRQLDLPPEEMERLKALPQQEKLDALATLGRREMQRRGPPPGVDAEEFKRWLELPPHEFMERMHGHGMRGFRGDGERGPPPDGRGRPGGFGRPGGPPDGPGGRPGLRPEGRDGERGPRPGIPPPDGPRGPRREGRLGIEGQRIVGRAMRPDPQWVIELADLPRELRREQIVGRIHARVIEVLGTQPAVTPAELAKLDALQGPEFFEALRDIVGDLPRGQGEFGRGPGEHRRRDRPRDDLSPPPRK
ncbi:MAG TPA: hypothetical protein VK843_21970 [Planctomycetota bacterium]|nr:hypothetical protein [Planctomycetota bacterium]